MKPINTHYKIKICANCGKDFMVKKGDGISRRLPNGVKPRGSINCSPRCTRMWREKALKEKVLYKTRRFKNE